MRLIPISPPTDYEREQYGIIGRSSYVYKVTGPNVHNRYSPHRVVVWDNTKRPNTTQDEPIRFVGDYGMQTGGPGRYRDPSGKDTDAEVSVYLSAESTAITNDGRNTGTVASGQVYSGVPLAADETVTLIGAGGESLGTYKVTAGRFADPRLIPA